VVGFGMVGYDDINLRRIDQLCDILDQTVLKRRSDRIDQNRLFINN